MMVLSEYRKDETSNLFAYGTLISPRIFQEIALCMPERIPAWLSGYRRFCIKNASYPGIVPWPGGKVSGILYKDMPTSSWKLLDEYEGMIYERKKVRITMLGGETIDAFAYVVRQEFVNLIEKVPWRQGC